MSEPIRLELTGKVASAFERVFDKLTDVIESAVDNIAYEPDGEIATDVKEKTKELAMISRGWLQAKVQKPILENEQLMADIAQKFEELKKTRAQTEQIQVQTERERLKLAEERLTMAIKWLGFLNQHVVRESSGRVTLILTNASLPTLLADMRAMSSS